MELGKLLALIVFVLISIIHLLGEFLIDRGKVQLDIIRNTTKPMLMPSLLIFYLLENNFPNVFIILALIFGFLGDIFLMIQTPKKTKKWLILGLVAFLIGHLFYISASVMIAGNFSHYLWWSIFLALPFLAVATVTQPILTKKTCKLTSAITIYIIVVCLMGISITFLFAYSSLYSFLLIYLGAWFFSLSDALNGYRRFVRPFPYKNVLIMFSYILGQSLLISGFTFL
ncbi:MAG: lysoplasmalogenase [Candidatus Heimdallarchaeaceae archaeon]